MTPDSPSDVRPRWKDDPKVQEARRGLMAVIADAPLRTRRWETPNGVVYMHSFAEAQAFDVLCEAVAAACVASLPRVGPSPLEREAVAAFLVDYYTNTPTPRPHDFALADALIEHFARSHPTGLREQVEAGLLLAAEHCSKVRDEYEKQGKHREATICRMLKGEIMALAGKKGWDRSRFCTVCGHDSHSGVAHGSCGGTPTRCGRCGKPKHDGYCIVNNDE